MVISVKYKKEHLYQKEVNSLALANEQIHLQAAYRNLLYNKCDSNSYTMNFANDNIESMNSAVKLPKVGVVKAKIYPKASEHLASKSSYYFTEERGLFL